MTSKRQLLKNGLCWQRSWG